MPQSPNQEITDGAGANTMINVHEEQDEGDDDSWNDSHLSSDEEHVTDNRLVKSKVNKNTFKVIILINRNCFRECLICQNS